MEETTNAPAAIAEELVSAVEAAPEEPQVETAEATPEEAQDAKEDALLEQLDPGREEDGEAPVAEEAAEAESEEQKEAADPTELADAYTVLRRDGFLPEDLKSLDDEAILRLAEHRKKVQTDVDRLIREGKEGKQDGDTEAAEQTQEDSEVAQPQAEATPDAPFTANLQEAATPIAEYLGLDDEGKGLLVKSYEAVVAPVLAQVQAMQSQMLQQEINAARAVLAEAYPQVADGEDENMQRVVSRMAQLYNPESDVPTSTKALMEEAIALEFREDFRKEAQSANQTMKRYQRNGMPDSPKGQRTQSREMTMEEKEAAVLDLLESDIPDRVQRAREIGGR
jgi:hypothetical protein